MKITLIIVAMILANQASSAQADNNNIDLSDAWLPVPTAKISGNSSICVGQSATLTIIFTNGPVDIVYTDGTLNYTDTGITTSPYQLSVSPTSTKTYTLVSVKNETCEGTVSGGAVVMVNPLPTATVDNIVRPSCYGYNDGEATINPKSGSMPFSYQWDNGEATTTNTSLSAGENHWVSITDANGCRNTYTFSVSQPDQLQLFVANTTNVNCAGPSSGSATVYAIGGTTPHKFTWSNEKVGSSVSELSAGNYTAYVTDANGCQASIPVTIVTDTPPIASISTISHVSCYSGSDGKATVNVSGGSTPYTYLWSNSQIGQQATGLAAGTYTVSVFDNLGCLTTTTAQVQQPAKFVATLNTTNINCDRSILGTATVQSVTGGSGTYSYVWDGTAGSSSKHNLTLGTHTIQIRDGNGCYSTWDTAGSYYNIQSNQYFTIEENPTPKAKINVNGNSVSCDNEIVNMTGLGGTTYKWFEKSNLDQTIGVEQSLNTIPGSSKDYVLVVYNEYGCTDTAQQHISVRASTPINFKIADKSFCSDDNEIDLSLYTDINDAGGNLTFHGSGIANGYFLPGNVELAQTVKITATYYNSNGCTSKDSQNVVVFAPPQVAFSISHSSVCETSGAIEISGGSPLATEKGSKAWYSMPENLNAFDTSQSLFYPQRADSGINTIRYHYIDKNGCYNMVDDYINVNTAMEAILTIYDEDLVFCSNDGQVKMTGSPSGGFFKIDSNSTSGVINPELLSPGKHKVVYVLDKTQCQDEDSATITVVDAPTVELSSTHYQMSEGDSIATISVEPLYARIMVGENWLPGMIFDPKVWGLGEHELIAFTTENGCSDTATITIVVGTVGFGDEKASVNIKAYPNPTNDIVYIEMDNWENISTIQVYDINGRIVANQTVNSNKTEISLNEVVAGQYFVQLFNKNGTAAKESIKILKR